MAGTRPAPRRRKATKAAVTPAERPLWTCPQCGARFVTRNMWHSCGRHSLDAFFEGRPRARELFAAWERFVRRAGAFEVVPQKTRIVFVARTRFAGVPRVRKDHIVAGFALSRAIDDPRFQRTEYAGTGWWGYRFRLEREDQLDPALFRLVKEAYEQMGMQRRLAGTS
jgi:uncharacterized protein DUF5655